MVQLYYYEKHEVQLLDNEYRMVEKETVDYTISYPFKVEGYTSYTFDSKTGTFGLNGVQKVISKDEYPYGYKVSSDKKELYYFKYYRYYNGIQYFKKTTYIAQQSEGAGNLIETIIAEDGAYPNNGKHTDGYWYIKVSPVKYVSKGTWESPIIDLGEGWKETKLVDVVKQLMPPTYSSNQIPTMTSNTSPSPYSAFASSDDGTGLRQAFRAFDKNNSSIWRSNNSSTGTLPQWIAFDFYTPKVIAKYTVTASSTNTANIPKSWTFEGSQDAANWVVLDSVTNAGLTTTNTKLERVISNIMAYRYYRVRVTEVNISGQNYVDIAEIEMMEAVPGTNVSLDISTSNDGVSFTPYIPLDPNNPPQGRYIKIRVTLSAQAQPREVKTLDFNQSSPENMMTLNEYTEANGKLQLKNSYTYSMTDDGTLGAGKQFSVTINKAKFKSINSLEVQ
ncbi:discoidin domain-containing protein [Parageobacillus galactosidasius]|uniref:F5/8 type C domain-containing protein n=1 Tax=Parageobacillus galactosidasius TaxID=883812 RepID=A0A226QQI7_9BACL|nr:discoidin domain-containing protein [Parageobacillus galactosidasius]OXB94741.1 hypothetical protein B9L23_07710 [Parageobacillus galactosidasius]